MRDKKKIYIATPIDYQNWGNRLQNYAVHQICKELDFQPETIEISEKSSIKAVIRTELVHVLSKLPEKAICNFKSSIFKAANGYVFSQKYIKRILVDKNTAIESLDKDSFVGIGGDQILSPYWQSRLDYCLFPTISPEKKICFSPSFGTDILPENYKAKIANQINKISFPAFREQSGVNIYTEITGKMAIQIADPVLTINREKWDQLITDRSFFRTSAQPYLLVYFLGNPDDEVRIQIDRYVEENKLICIDISKNSVQSKWKNADPRDFIKLIKNAHVVFTDSYHATIFCLIYHKCFIVFRRNSTSDMNTRLVELLDHYSIQQCYYSGEIKVFKNLNYEMIDKQIEFDKEAAWMYYRSFAEGKKNLQCHELNQDQIRRYVFYSFMSKDEKVLAKSSSGGIFFHLAKHIIEENGVVCGAAITEDCVVKHVLIDNIYEIASLMESKYVQSDMNDVFYKVLENLKIGKKVLFVGTPCQVDGLTRYLKKEYSNLITCDFACHGVPSPDAFATYLSTFHSDKKIQYINFRNKEHGWRNFSMRIQYSDGSVYSQDKNHDPYLKSFIKNLSLRPSCYSCKLKGANRSSDLTIGDFWGDTREIDVGTSFIWVRSQKGVDIINDIKDELEYRIIDEENVKFRNAGFNHSAFLPVMRYSFYTDIRHNPRKVFQNIEKYNKSNYVKKVLMKYLVLRKANWNKKSTCSGCTACASICPKQAIHMCCDEEGFSYPIIDSSACVHCGLCTKICNSPVIK